MRTEKDGADLVRDDDHGADAAQRMVALQAANQILARWSLCRGSVYEDTGWLWHERIRK